MVYRVSLNITYLKGNDAPRLDELLPVCLSLCGAFCSYTQMCIGWHLQHHCVIFVSHIISCLSIYLTGAEVRIILEEF